MLLLIFDSNINILPQFYQMLWLVTSRASQT